MTAQMNNRFMLVGLVLAAVGGIGTAMSFALGYDIGAAKYLVTPLTLIGIGMMLAAANLNFIAFWRFSPRPHPPTGVMVAIFSIAIAAAEAAVGLALVISVYRHYRTTNVDQYDQLKG